MGVPSLWEVLEPVQTKQSLLVCAVEYRKQSKLLGCDPFVERQTTLRLGVDMGTLMAECNAAARLGPVFSQKAGGGLFFFFRRLMGFLKLPIQLIFVFDGSDRPPIKRHHEVIHWSPMWWEDQAVEFIEAFGYEAHKAPAEAEAELAQLSIQGHIDAIITTDSDACVFGASKIFKPVAEKHKEFPDEYQVYETPGPAQVAAGFPVSAGSLVLCALLAGGDYDDGIEGCGSMTSFALARCGFGDDLVDAFRSMTRAEFEDVFLPRWRRDLRNELKTNSNNFLSFTRPNTAKKIQKGFPSYDILNLYVNPVTSWSPGNVPLSQDFWVFSQPSIPSITRLCKQYFHWKSPLLIQKKFHKDLWEGICLQIMYSPFTAYFPHNSTFYRSHMHFQVTRESHQKRRGQYSSVYGDELQPKLIVSTAHFTEYIGQGLGRNVQHPSIEQVTLWPHKYIYLDATATAI